MIHQIQIKNQVPAIIKDSKIKMLPFTHTRKIGDTIYVVSTGYSDGAKEDALAKMKRVILSADVKREQECAMLNMLTPNWTHGQFQDAPQILQKQETHRKRGNR